MLQSNGTETFARRETLAEKIERNRQECANPKVRMLLRKYSKMDDAVNTYEYARRRGLVTYSPLGLRSRHDA